jgi:hypothetical protein
MPRITKKQLESIIDKMADSQIMWQEKFNKAQLELEKLDGKPRLRVRTNKQDLIDSYYAKLYRHDDEKIDD